ncbi:MAG: amidohydrolase family protein, partial [Candidatus Thorarchaeota archaeon]
VCSTVNEFGTGKRSAGELYEFDKEAGEKKLQDGEALVKTWHEKEDGRITCHFGPQAADMMSEGLLHSTKELAIEYGTKVHMHIAQGGRERSQMMKRYGKSTVRYLKSIGYLDKSLIGVHCHDASREEINELASNGVSMIGCPGSIGLIDGMAPPFHEFISSGGIVALGSDQCPPAGHNMFNQMRYAALLTKVKHKDPTLLPTWKLFQLATIDGARCHGLEDRIGSLEKGKRADIVLLRLEVPSMTPNLNKPIRNLIPNIVFSATGSEVSTVLIDGQIVIDKGEVKTVNEKQILRDAQKEAEKIGELANNDFHDAGSLLSKMMQDGKL